MYYYIIDNRIIMFTEELDNSLYNFTKLNDNQVAFYLQHTDATVTEIINMQVNTIVIDELQQAKEQKIQEIENEYYSAILGGYYDSELNITIKIADEDRNAFNQRITLLSLLPDGMKPQTTVITDKDGNPVELSIQNFFSFMVRMGLYFDTQVWSKRTLLMKEVRDATNIETVNNITWNN